MLHYLKGVISKIVHIGGGGGVFSGNKTFENRPLAVQLRGFIYYKWLFMILNVFCRGTVVVANLNLMI